MKLFDYIKNFFNYKYFVIEKHGGYMVYLKKGFFIIKHQHYWTELYACENGNRWIKEYTLIDFLKREKYKMKTYRHAQEGGTS